MKAEIVFQMNPMRNQEDGRVKFFAQVLSLGPQIVDKWSFIKFSSFFGLKEAFEMFEDSLPYLSLPCKTA